MLKKSLLLVLLSGGLSGCAVVEPNESAVRVTFGSVSKEVLPPGAYINLMSEFHRYDARMQAQTVSLDNFTKDLQHVKAEVVVKYTVNPSNLVHIYQNVAANNELLFENYVSPVVRSTFKAMVSQYDLEDLVSQREKFQELVEKHLAEKFKKDKTVLFSSLSLTDLTLDAKFTQAIEDKQVALQKLAQAKTEVEISEQEAKKMKALEMTLSDKMLTKMFLDKWDGKTPLYFQPSGVQLLVSGNSSLELSEEEKDADLKRVRQERLSRAAQ